MAFFTRGNARIYFEDKGEGEPVIAVHGLIENVLYWKFVEGKLSRSCRFIPMEMRGHGRTVVEGEPDGFDVDTVGEDIVALADHLGLERFHLLTHSTGGFAGVRYAMRDSSRFASLILTNTGSATSVIPAEEGSIRRFHDKFAQTFIRFDWPQMVASLRVIPGPFFRGIVESDKKNELLRFALEMVSQNDRPTIARFIRSFYRDPDPKVEGLRRITCPTLVVYGEKDDLFVESSRLMAREIPGAKLIRYKGVGHMTALEVPELLARDVLVFLADHPLKPGQDSGGMASV
ncbi:MAG TPA: alpha/beta hydrolase [Deltaproteobacteria bacterium]|jgi:pimeloyl-ACP methyl ester carboxylesterase|nr:alpha/beta hydrolase [Deltaproteobacteria bacterium]HOI05617.1 alpha/beta hydrolase [Deltaproteobacteria bacterium]